MLNLYRGSLLENTPQYEKALFEKGRCLQRIFNYDGARATFLRYLAAYPDGVYAAQAREQLGLLASSASKDLEAPPAFR
jgi:TolA-binding protein